MKKSKIAFIEPVGMSGGMHYYDIPLAQEVSNLGLEVILFTSALPDTDSTRNFKVEFPFEKFKSKTGRGQKAFSYVFGFLQSLYRAKVEGCDIIHFHLFTANPIQSMAMKMARMLGLSVILTVHDVESLHVDNRKRLKKTYLACDKIVVHNEFSKQELIRIFDIEPSLIYIAPHGNYIDSYYAEHRTIEESDLEKRTIEESDLEKAVLEKLFAVREDRKKFIILFFGQIKKTKRLDLLIEAMNMLDKNRVRPHLIVAGKAVDYTEGELDDLLDTAEFDTTVLNYRIPDSIVPDLFKCANVVALPYERIYQSGVLLMAMSFRTPVIASALPPNLEILRDGKNGFVFEPGSATALRAVIETCMENPEKTEIVGRHGFITAQRDYSWEKSAIAHSAVYQSLATSAGMSTPARHNG